MGLRCIKAQPAPDTMLHISLQECSMPRWEYRTLDLNDVPRKQHAVDLLSDAGEDGWELVHITANNVAYLKRQIDEPTPAKLVRRRSATSSAEDE